MEQFGYCYANQPIIEILNSSSNILPWFQLLGTLLIAYLAAEIAWRQSQIAKAKLEHDMFEKRYSVYKATQTFVSNALISEDRMPAEIVTDFYNEKAAALFLFPIDVVLYINQLETLYIRQRMSVADIINAGEDDDKRAIAIQKSNVAYENITNELNKMNMVFYPHISAKPIHSMSRIIVDYIKSKVFRSIFRKNR